MGGKGNNSGLKKGANRPYATKENNARLKGAVGPELGKSLEGSHYTFQIWDR